MYFNHARQAQGLTGTVLILKRLQFSGSETEGPRAELQSPLLCAAGHGVPEFTSRGRTAS